MYEPIAFIELINKLKVEGIPFEIITKRLSEDINKAFITFPFMTGDVALFCEALKGGPRLRIETYDAPWDPTGDITIWLPEEEKIDKLFQYIKIYWKGYNAAH